MHRSLIAAAAWRRYAAIPATSYIQPAVLPVLMAKRAYHWHGEAQAAQLRSDVDRNSPEFKVRARVSRRHGRKFPPDQFSWAQLFQLKFH